MESKPAQYLYAGWVKAFIWGVPVINSLLLITSLAGWTSFSWLGLSFGIFLVLSFGIIKRATYIQETYGKQLKSLNGYARLIALAKAENWKSTGMLELIERFNLNGQSPIQALQQLSKELDRLDLRNNQFLYVLLEGSIFFQLQEIVRIERWKVRYGQHISEWLETVGELDALCSLVPLLQSSAIHLPGTDRKAFLLSGHTNGASPYASFTMREKRCHHSVASVFLIITGANMAGKSTYLRTIGVNYLLACIGAPVCCERLKLYPNQLITSCAPLTHFR